MSTDSTNNETLNGLAIMKMDPERNRGCYSWDMRSYVTIGAGP